MKKRAGSNPETALHVDPTTMCISWTRPGGGWHLDGYPRD
jgi:hypothetical protein